MPFKHSKKGAKSRRSDKPVKEDETEKQEEQGEASDEGGDGNTGEETSFRANKETPNKTKQDTPRKDAEAGASSDKDSEKEDLVEENKKSPKSKKGKRGRPKKETKATENSDKEGELISENSEGEASKENAPDNKQRQKGRKRKASNEMFKGYAVLESDEESLPDVNIFSETITTEAKRKRAVPVVNQVLSDWISTHLQASETVILPFGEVYELYVGDCVGMVVVDETQFRQYVKQQFTKGCAIKEDSIHKSEIKTRKLVDKSKKKEKVEGETMKLKMQEVIDIVLRELGNPEGGIRFHKLNMTAAAKFPARRLHINPNIMINAIDKGVRKKQLVCVRGIGKCGFYRLPTPAGDGDNEETKEEEEEDDSKMPPKKRKSQRQGDEGDGEGKGSLSDTVDKKSASLKKKGVKVKQRSIGRISHSNPQRAVHVFPMAFTFQSEPKVASMTKVRNYIQSYYPQVYTDAKFKKTMEEGFGFSDWMRLSGHGSSGSVQLTIEEWNPKYDDNMRELIINAIIACSEPKVASSTLIKKYIEEFHPRFKINLNPSKFKKAMELAIEAGLVVQLSGIGLSGTFQLDKIFEPSPANLAGEDSGDEGSDEEEEDDDSEESEEEEIVVPKSKNRGHLRKQSRKSYSESIDGSEDEYKPQKHVSSRGRLVTVGGHRVRRK